jgi:act minimal PKS acyl carrier protein
MPEFTRDDLNRLLREGAGEEVDLDGDVLDTPFDELGYDSLAILELSIRLKREFNIVISEDELIDMTTPRATLRITGSRTAVG